MPYTKTAWVDGQAPLVSATNLNKIEQGIEYAHQVSPVQAIIATDGSGDYTTLQSAYDAGITKYGIKGEYVMSVGGGIVIDNTVKSSFINVPRIEFVGIDNDAQITNDTDDYVVTTSNPPSGVKGSDTISTFGNGNLMQLSGTTDWALAGVEVGMVFQFTITTDSEWRHITETMYVREIAGTVLQLDKFEGSLRYHGGVNVEWESFYLNLNGFAIKDIKIENSGNASFFMGTGGYGWKNVRYENIRVVGAGNRDVALMQGSGRLWNCTAINVTCDNGTRSIGNAYEADNSRVTLDVGHYGVAINCSNFEIRYIPSNLDATWINCRMHGNYLEGSTNARGTLIGCMITDKTDIIADWGSFKTYGCMNQEGEYIPDGTGDVLQRVWAFAEVTGTITPAKDKINVINCGVTNTSRAVTLNKPSGIVNGDESTTTVRISLTGSSTTPSNLTVTFPSRVDSHEGYFNTMTITGSTSALSETIVVTLVQYEISNYMVGSIQINDASDGSVVFSNV